MKKLKGVDFIDKDRFGKLSRDAISKLKKIKEDKMASTEMVKKGVENG